jgi:NADH:ubiquinone oxidoreductase subunit 6 (subunit J)
VDRQAAAAAADIQGRVNRACSDASFLRTAAAAMFVLLGLSLVPLISFVMYLGFIITFFAVIVMVIRWQMRFCGLQTNDVDYGRAKRMRNVALVLWLLAIPLFLLREVLGALIARVLM